MKHFAQRRRDRTRIWIRRHHVTHVRPPSPTLRRLRDSRPTGLILDFDIGKKLMRFRQQKDRVVVYSMRFEHGFKLRPDRPMPTLILGLRAGINGHNKCLTDHGVTAWGESRHIQRPPHAPRDYPPDLTVGTRSARPHFGEGCASAIMHRQTPPALAELPVDGRPFLALNPPGAPPAAKPPPRRRHHLGAIPAHRRGPLRLVRHHHRHRPHAHRGLSR